MADFIDEVAALTRRKVEGLKLKATLESLKHRINDLEPSRGFQKCLRQSNQVTVIAELKQASPSAGVIRKEPDIEGRISAYVKGGAAALSILTEDHYFHGSTQLLERARKTGSAPILRKDFIVDPYQIYESRAFAADAVLLIVSLLPGAMLRDFLKHAEDARIDTLVEIHHERELDAALQAGASVIGINNRDLRTLQVDPTTSARLAPRVAKDRTLVIESGVRDPSEMPKYKSMGAHAVLIGEALMRSSEPESIVRTFVEAGKQ